MCVVSGTERQRNMIEQEYSAYTNNGNKYRLYMKLCRQNSEGEEMCVVSGTERQRNKIEQGYSAYKNREGYSAYTNIDCI